MYLSMVSFLQKYIEYEKNIADGSNSHRNLQCSDDSSCVGDYSGKIYLSKSNNGLDLHPRV